MCIHTSNNVVRDGIENEESGERSDSHTLSAANSGG
jgi:hypothetical protein